jgi:hypothetical protein
MAGSSGKSRDGDLPSNTVYCGGDRPGYNGPMFRDKQKCPGDLYG